MPHKIVLTVKPVSELRAKDNPNNLGEELTESEAKVKIIGN